MTTIMLKEKNVIFVTIGYLALRRRAANVKPVEMVQNDGSKELL